MPAGHPDISGEAAPAPTATGIEAYEEGKDIAYVYANNHYAGYAPDTIAYLRGRVEAPPG